MNRCGLEEKIIVRMLPNLNSDSLCFQYHIDGFDTQAIVYQHIVNFTKVQQIVASHNRRLR